MIKLSKTFDEIIISTRGLRMLDQIDQSNIWDLATLKQKIALKNLEASQYESIILQVIDESGEDFEKIPEKLREVLGV